MVITSDSNPKLKYVKRLQTDRRFRKREAVFVAEGVRWLSDVISMGIEPVMLFVSDSAELPPNSPSCPTFTVPPSIMRDISDVESPPGILMVLPQPSLTLPASPAFILTLDAIQTPGNLGTMLRSAAAAGVSGVLLGPGCVDAFNPKVVRGGMGAHLRLPVQAATWPEIAAAAAALSVQIASAEGETLYSEHDWQQPSMLIIGNEANGPGADARQLGSAVRIPMAAQTESLNAAMAATVILFEAARQRS